MSYLTGYCFEVIDGDTLKIDLDGQPCKVRLLGIDTPEAGKIFRIEKTG